MTKKFDFGIIGAGPAGYTAAIRASQLGKSVVLFEKEFVGGTCLNKGCIPTKAILRSVEAYNSLKKISNFGVNVENYSLDFAKVAERKDKTVEKIRKSLEILLKSYGIEIVYAEATIKGSNDAKQILANDEIYECSNLLIATGAEPKCVGGFDFDHEFILSSDDVLELKELPKKLVIAGSGAIGIEWARIFSSFGVEVSVIEIADKLLPLADTEISDRLARTFKMSKIKTFISTSIKSISNKKVELSSGEILEPDFVLFATGRKPAPLPPKCEGASPHASRLTPHLIGDCFGGIQLAHFASHQAVQVVNNIVLGEEIKDFIVPAVVYGHPEIAWIGKTEQELEGSEFKKSVFPLAALGKAQCDGDLEGFVKILTDDSGNILGAHIIGAEASALIHQLSIAMQNGIKADELKHCCFAHPTYSEGVYEALLGLDNESLSLLKSE